MKRIISLMLSLIIILSLVCVAAPAVSAASTMKTSTNGINMIKSFEGFSKTPYYDVTQWTVGYGTSVSAAEAEKYMISGITEEQATKLLAQALASFETSVNSFITTHNLSLAQHQFDALVCFTYNLGPNWMNEKDGVFRSAVINGTKGNDFVYAMAQFGKAGGVAVPNLIERRLCEANLYLNGIYGTAAPVNYKYVIYDGNLEGATPNVTIQGYDTTVTSAIKATVSKSGYRFLGWYTSATGGEWITALNTKSAGVKKLYAHWQNGEGELNTDGSIKGVAAAYSGYAPAGAQKTYKAPNGAEDGSVKADERVSVVAEYMASNGVKWGKLSSGKWMVVTNGLAATPNYEAPGSAIEPMIVTVTSNNINNRIGPGTNYAKQGTYTKGQKLTLTAVQKGGNYTWGKSEQGWIALIYTNYETTKLQSSADAKKVTAIGTIIKTDVVNVRAGAGTQYPKVGTYNRNDEIKITLRQKVGNSTWGLTEKGWVSLYYAKVTEVAAGSVPDINISTGTIGGATGGITGGTVVGGTTGSASPVTTGMIHNCDVLRIRSGAGTSNAHIGDYPRGTYVTIYETTTVRSELWGRTDKGWISLRYVKLDAPTTGLGVTGRVVKCDVLAVRSGAGTHYPKVDKLVKGTQVEILEYTKVGKATWGRTNKGWVSLYYISLDAPITNLDVKFEAAPPATEAPTTESEATKYVVGASAMTNGKVSVNTASAAKGEVVTMTVTPNANYVLDTLTVKDASGAEVAVSNNKFTMPESNVVISATFKIQYNVKINAATGGKVTANTTACDANTKILLTVTPDAGYALETLSYVNTKTNAVTELYNDKTSDSVVNAFTMPAADVNVVATFKQSKGTTYGVKVNAATNGEVAANIATAKSGENVVLVVNPAADYVLDTLSVRDSANKVISYAETEANTFTFKMPKADVTVAATFKRAKFDVVISKATGGSVTIAEPGTYKKGETVTLVVAENAEYKLKELTVKAGSTAIETKNSGSTYTFVMPAESVEVKAKFEKIQYALTLKKPQNGTVKTADGKTSYAKGDEVELIPEPAEGYKFKEFRAWDAAEKPMELTITDGKFTMPGHATMIRTYFELAEYAVKFETVDGVHMSADKTVAKMGDTVTLNVYGLAGYKVKSMSVKDAEGKAITVSAAKFTMPASDVTVSVEVEKIPYNVTGATTANGSVTTKVAGPFTVGDVVELNIQPKQEMWETYALDTLTVKTAAGANVDVDGNKFTMPASDVVITATFKRAFKVNAPSGVTANPATAAPGDEVTLTVAQRDGYRAVLTVKENYTNKTVPVTDGKFTMPEFGVNITVEYQLISYTVTANKPENGTASLSTSSATKGQNVTVTVTPEWGYSVKEIAIKDSEGASVSYTTQNLGYGSIAYTFKMPASDVAVDVSFRYGW